MSSASDEREPTGGESKNGNFSDSVMCSGSSGRCLSDPGVHNGMNEYPDIPRFGADG